MKVKDIPHWVSQSTMLTPSSSSCSLSLSRVPSTSTLRSQFSDIPTEDGTTWRKTFQPILPSIVGSPPVPSPQSRVSQMFYSSTVSNITGGIFDGGGSFSGSNFTSIPQRISSSSNGGVLSQATVRSASPSIVPGSSSGRPSIVSPMILWPQKWHVEEVVVFDNYHDDLLPNGSESSDSSEYPFPFNYCIKLCKCFD